MRSPSKAKHHVVVQYMAWWMKCPLPPPPTHPAQAPYGQTPHSQTPQWTAWLVEDKEDEEELMNKEELMTLPCCKGLRTAVALSTASCWCRSELGRSWLEQSWVFAEYAKEGGGGGSGVR